MPYLKFGYILVRSLAFLVTIFLFFFILFYIFKTSVRHETKNCKLWKDFNGTLRMHAVKSFFVKPHWRSGKPSARAQTVKSLKCSGFIDLISDQPFACKKKITPLAPFMQINQMQMLLKCVTASVSQHFTPFSAWLLLSTDEMAKISRRRSGKSYNLRIQRPGAQLKEGNKSRERVKVKSQL